MEILILGGTRFLGRHTVEAALMAGHTITLFNRGQSSPNLFPDVETLVGDRDGDLDVLKGRKWDVAIDTCGYFPRLVSASTEALADSVEHYTFVSSISVYAEVSQLGMDESASVAMLEDETVEEITGETYGGLKALCETVAEEAMPGRVLQIRSGLIVGPHDPTNRFTYWPMRIAKGGDVFAPSNPDVPVQFIDARDQAAWILQMADNRKAGVYNVTGPRIPMTLGQLLEICIEVSGGAANLVWVDAEFLAKQEISPWMEMPLYVPEEMSGMNQASIEKAVGDGLIFRPVADTVRDTLKWVRSLDGDPPGDAGIAPEKEAEVLAAWNARN